MKTYQVGDELEKILINQGFIETTSNRDKIKGKKSFKLSKQSKKEIYFDYENIIILNSNQGQDSRMSLKETELKLLLLYFKLKSTDYKEFDEKNKFNFFKAEKRLSSIKTEIERLEKFNLHGLRKEKLKRIIETFNKINLVT